MAEALIGALALMLIAEGLLPFLSPRQWRAVFERAVQMSDGRPLTIAPSSWGEGRLIRCPENYSYYFPRICNVWTAQALQSCGFSIKTSSSLSANGLIREATSEENGFRKIWDPDTDRLPAGAVR